MQALGFLHKYARLRGNCQEVMYNIGRVFHQLGTYPATLPQTCVCSDLACEWVTPPPLPPGVLHIACHFYKHVLCMEPECQLPQVTMDTRHLISAIGSLPSLGTRLVTMDTRTDGAIKVSLFLPLVVPCF